MNGCLLIHGFTGNPDEVMPLAKHLSETTDWLIRTPTLPGHGQHDSLYGVAWEDWQQKAEDECKALLAECEKVYLVGFSMGGVIAAHLATKYPIERLVLLSAAVFGLHPQQMVEDLKQIFFVPDKREQSVEQDLERYRYKIRNTPLRAVMQFRKLIKQLKPSISKVHVPILIVHGQKDSLVNPRSADYIFEQVQSEEKDILYLQKSKHVVCHDCETEELFPAVTEFLTTEASPVH